MRQLRRFLPPFLAVLTLLAGPAWADRCREDTLPGPWRSQGSGNIWMFHGDGQLTCTGACRFTAITGDPVSWAYEPHANVWARPIDYVKLVFTKATFDGVMGAFRCYIEDDGRTLRLQAESEGSMVFERAE